MKETTKDLGSEPVLAVKSKRVRVELLTDPWSVWCWGFEPVRRTLALRYPTIEFRTIMGGMFPQMPDPAEHGFDVERFFATVQRTTGMPIRTLDRGQPRPTTTLTAARHVYAVRAIAPEKEAAFVRAQRETLYLDGLNINDIAVAKGIARRIGIDEDRFEKAFQGDATEAAHKRVLGSLDEKEMNAYPTLTVAQGGRSARIEGFHTLPSLLSVVETVALKPQPPLPDPKLEDVVPLGERVATREVAEAMGLSAERAIDVLLKAHRSGFLKRERFATGDAWSRKPS